ncbi:endonuclease domain-containing protein [Sphingomonas sp.]|uniref:endonuclease domain-containing protein n=1 Tax=Sphingomonas sp. TaxID=28214 RepID=UPI0025D3B4A2|nr:endonuclease domain-containing protein [Sphingomonas sp.]
MKRPPGEEPLEFQRRVRHEPTEPEKKLWSALRNRQIADAKIRKQTWLCGYLVDFYCAAAKLVIEVDGDTHAHQQDYDERRTARLESEGFRVIRFSNDDVVRNPDGVVACVREALDPSPSHSAAPSLPQGERGQ